MCSSLLKHKCLFIWFSVTLWKFHFINVTHTWYFRWFSYQQLTVDGAFSWCITNMCIHIYIWENDDANCISTNMRHIRNWLNVPHTHIYTKVEHTFSVMHGCLNRLYSNFRPTVHISKLLKCGCYNLIRHREKNTFHFCFKWKWSNCGPLNIHVNWRGRFCLNLFFFCSCCQHIVCHTDQS